MFIKNYLKKQEGKGKYKEELSDIVLNKELNDTSKKKLSELIKEYHLSSDDLSNIQENTVHELFEKISENERITADGEKKLMQVSKYLNVDLKQDKELRSDFTKYRSLDMLDHGELPTVNDLSGLNILLKEKEVVHCYTKAVLMKHKRVIQRIQYHGFSSSIRIMKGLRYRAGSYRVGSQSKDFLIAADTGIFWITNQRIGFKGQQKDFDIKYDKILSFDLTDDGMVIAKQGRENPYIIQLGYYEVPVRIISMILNGDKK